MVSQGNLARPYARALFELAGEQGETAAWSEQLSMLAVIAAHPMTRSMISHPQVSDDELRDLVEGVAGDALTEGGRNLLRLLIHNNRLEALPAIARAYAERRAEAESTVQARMTTAATIDESRQRQFVEVLQNKLGRTVKLDFDVDQTLIGGAVIRAGDTVIDGSVRAQLEQLATAVTS